MSDNQIAQLKQPATSSRSNREFAPQATLGMQDHLGNNLGLLNLVGDRESDAEAQHIAQLFCNSLDKMTVPQKSVCTFHAVNNANGKVAYRLANAANRTIGFVNNSKYDLSKVTLADVAISVYASICTTEEDFDTLLGV